jgi:glucose/arabinose dehydrogenase
MSPLAYTRSALPSAILCLALAGCGDDVAAPLGATARVVLQVPPALRTDLLAEERHLEVPPGFSISVIARIPGARFLAVAPNGDLLVSRPGVFGGDDPALEGKIYLVRAQAPGEAYAVSEFATGLRLPHTLAFKAIGKQTFLYVSESNQVIRAAYQPGDTQLGPSEVVVGDLPDGYSGELRGRYGHALKNFALGKDRIYVSVASATNADPSDVLADPPRAAIYVADLEGKNRRLYARGLRNAEGLDISPEGELWVVVNHRDVLPFPPGHPTQGAYDQLYIDDHPAEPFTRVRDGGNYGWPFCNPNPDGGADDLPFDRDWDNNADGHVDCSTMDRVSKGIKAHSAPLGLSFLQGSAFPERYRNGVVATLHGCWNCSRLIGHKVIYWPWRDGRPGEEIDLVSGWIIDPVAQSRWGRPVDAVPDLEGNLIISDDYSGTLYKLSPTR